MTLAKLLSLQLVLGFLLLVPGPGWATDFTISTIQGLEDALSQAQQNGADDTITIDAGTYNLTATLSYDSQEDHSLIIQSNGGMVTLDATYYQGLLIRTYTANAHVTIRGVTICNGFVLNPKIGGGANIRTQSANITIENTYFSDNRASHIYFATNGAGLFLKVEGSGRIRVSGNTFQGNYARGTGGGLYIVAGSEATVELSNNIFSDNEASTKGGGGYIFLVSGTLNLINNTFINNTTGYGDGGGGLYARLYFDSLSANIFNNIIRGNTADNGVGEDLYLEDDGDGNGFGAEVFMSNNNYGILAYAVGDNLTLVNNIDTDPLLSTDLRLQAGSPCIDAATNTAPSLPAVDIDGETRDSQPDMGADEYIATDVEDFVSRFYEQCLGRSPDQAGLDYWTTALLQGDYSGEDLAYSFIFSEEFQARNTTDNEYVTIFYRAFFAREPDSAGYEYWLYSLASGTGRLDVLYGFTASNEFVALCEAYGIVAQQTLTPVEQFINRFYEQCLGRSPDQAGLDYWSTALLHGDYSGEDLAYSFIFNEEFLARNTADSEYMTILYRAFLAREPDSTGYEHWLYSLASG
ncbi:MAG: DUF4214 domain-containing protein, partial [Desulfobulbaceae bacterium]|nr:DUF4214 domain-containing protein [Desulfobulbaceae bacterium]